MVHGRPPLAGALALTFRLTRDVWVFALACGLASGFGFALGSLIRLN